MVEKSKKIDVLGSLIFCGIGFFAMFLALRLGLGMPTEPGPGFFPFLGALLLTTISIILFFMALYGLSTGSSPFAGVWIRPAVMFLGSIVYVSIINFTGFMIATFFLTMVTLRVLGSKQWWSDVAVCLFLSVGAYFLFARLMDVPLPKGIIIHYLIG